MAIGDQSDMLNRLQTVLPASWWGSITTIRDGVLSGFSNALSNIYSLTNYVYQQSRISTATDVFLDIIANDFFGTDLQRQPNESDDAYRTRILANLLQPAGTRAAIVEAIERLTGNPPIIIEPRNATDLGGWGMGCGYGAGGHWGSINLPSQFFVIAFPGNAGGGIATVNGYGGYMGGWGVGATEWIGPSIQTYQVTDQDIYDTINAVRAAGTTAWVLISNISLLDENFLLNVSDLD